MQWLELPSFVIGCLFRKGVLNVHMGMRTVIGLPFFQVHHGFYSAYYNTTLRPGVLNAVKEAMDSYGKINIIVTGHSMGGAMAGFCGLDLSVPILLPLFLIIFCCFYTFPEYGAFS